ncbi:MAG: hypothetical protein IPO62_14875 [Saprospiraceae bacterium]|nr:hypothetical protein [Saprospiraceae bacterium]
MVKLIMDFLKLRYIIIIFLVLSNFRCSGQQQSSIELFPLLKTDSIFISRSMDGFNFFGIRSFEDNNYFVYKDEEKLIMKMVSIKDGTTSVLNLEDYLPDSILYNNDFEDICLLGGDSILILFNSHIVFLSGNKLVNILKINQRLKGEWPHLIFQSFKPLGNLVFDKINGEVYLRIMVGDEYVYNRKFWNESILAKYKLASSTIKILPVKYSKLYQDHYLGDVVFNQICKINNEIYISFLASNDFYSIQLKNGQVQHGKFPISGLDKSDLKYFKFGKEVPMQQRIDNITLNPLYDNIIPASNKEIKLRFFRSGIPLKNSDGLFNSKLDKKTTIMVISQENKLLKEYLLPIDIPYDSYYCFVLNSKIYINNLNEDAASNQFIHFDGFDIEELKN